MLGNKISGIEIDTHNLPPTWSFHWSTLETSQIKSLLKSAHIHLRIQWVGWFVGQIGTSHIDPLRSSSSQDEPLQNLVLGVKTDNARYQEGLKMFNA